MTITERTREHRVPTSVAAAPVPPSAVVWIDDQSATVARVDDSGWISTQWVDRGPDAEIVYVEHVIREIGDRERVMILGPDSVRLALEREYVAIYRRPDRLVDVEPSGAVDEVALVQHLRRLAS
jgi:hypothetical protein